MLDGVSLDQLRTFIAASDAGSFSAAARRLGRAQSMVSETVRSLEAQLRVPLFDRAGRYPALTPQGLVLLADARAVVGGVDSLKARAKGMSEGIEPELAVVVDVFFPVAAITQAAVAFRSAFPATPLRLYVEALGGALQPLLDGRAGLAVVGPAPILPPDVLAEPITRVPVVMVASADHPLARHGGVIPEAELAEHVQLVLTDRSDLSAGREFDVRSPSTWRVADLFAKHALLLAGLGWGGMPLHTVEADLAAGRLARLALANGPPSLPMTAAYRAAEPPGPAGRWMIDGLKQWARAADAREPVSAGAQAPALTRGRGSARDAPG